MTPAEVKVLIVIGMHANNTWSATLSLERLASKAGLTVSAACAAIRRLVKAGVLLRSRGGGRGQFSTYSLITDRSNSDSGNSVATNTVSRPPKLSTPARETLNAGAFASVLEQREITEENREQSTAPIALNGDSPASLIDVGEPSTFAKIRDLWMRKWTASHDRKDYHFVGAKDAKALKAIIAWANDDQIRIAALFDEYLADDSDFYRGHDLVKLASQLNRFATQPTRVRAAATGGYDRSRLMVGRDGRRRT